jgi:hypothetical protein
VIAPFSVTTIVCAPAVTPSKWNSWRNTVVLLLSAWTGPAVAGVPSIVTPAIWFPVVAVCAQTPMTHRLSATIV